MASKSFYNLDDIIDLNEKRLEQYTSSYQKILDRLTTIILIYSAITVFLISLIQDVFFEKNVGLLFILCLILFAVLFIISLIYFVKLILPVDIAYLDKPEIYYTDYRLEYEKEITEQAEVDKLLKASYIDELEKAIENNKDLSERKSSFYFNSLLFILIASPFFLVCLGLHISKKDDKIQKVQIIKSENNPTFIK